MRIIYWYQTPLLIVESKYKQYKFLIVFLQVEKVSKLTFFKLKLTL